MKTENRSYPASRSQQLRRRHAMKFAGRTGPVAAQSYGDPASGLTVDPPQPFVAKPGRPHPQFDVAIDVASTADKRLCTVGFRNKPENNRAIDAQRLGFGCRV
jgi:hypothetical protein